MSWTHSIHPFFYSFILSFHSFISFIHPSTHSYMWDLPHCHSQKGVINLISFIHSSIQSIHLIHSVRGLPHWSPRKVEMSSQSYIHQFIPFSSFSPFIHSFTHASIHSFMWETYPIVSQKGGEDIINPFLHLLQVAGLVRLRHHVEELDTGRKE